MRKWKNEIVYLVENITAVKYNGMQQGVCVKNCVI